jgi:predicted sulfurtransferase/23S rRNA-/tRNA-specific pseudouridylate synthase
LAGKAGNENKTAARHDLCRYLRLLNTTMAVEDKENVDEKRMPDDSAAVVAASTTSESDDGPTASRSRPCMCIILFYKYHPLSDDPSIVELYKLALEWFCVSLNLKGRILVGCSEHRSEGINGTLSGTKANLEIFVKALGKHNNKRNNNNNNVSSPNNTTNTKAETESAAVSTTEEEAWNRFRTDCEAFYRSANCPPLEMEESEFKWSELDHHNTGDNNNDNKLFPDLNIKIVNELIGTGGALSSIQINDLHKGYLTPHEWHERIARLQQANKKKNDSAIGGKGGEDENDKDDNTDDEADTILIDCRNTKECAIGNFVGSIDPQTTTFNQFPKWVDDHKHKLRNKNVLMYCTGGIRCEKASAYVRQAMGSSVKEVMHLKGGIHKYLEAYGDDGDGHGEAVGPQGATTNTNDALASTPASAPASSLWRGKNFVFDGRGAHGPGASSDTASAAVGTSSPSTAFGACRYCDAPYDSFDPHCVCTVCKEPILVCKTCQGLPATQNQQQKEEEEGGNPGSSSNPQTSQSPNRPQHFREYHCVTHKHLEGCYFTNLEGFSQEELEQQLSELDTLAKDIAVGKKFRQRRKTLAKQRAKIEARLLETMQQAAGGVENRGNNASNNNDNDNSNNLNGIELKCRNCGQIGCSGKCWGFHGLKRKRVLEQKEEEQQQQRHGKECLKETSGIATAGASTTKVTAKNKHNERLKQQKELQKQKQIEEWIASGLTLGPKIGRDPNTGFRVPKPCVRVLQTTTKGKWCGRSLLKVLQTEFPNSWQSREPQQQQQQHISSLSSETEAENTLRVLLRKGLIRVNGNPIKSLDEANSYKLKNMDVIDRIVHWHEPPIHLPSETIEVQKIPIPQEFLSASSKTKQGTAGIVYDNHIYVCNKPSTVPVHPAGPYLSNSLTLLVEAQEGLRPKSLIPCHRIDRVTSGMTICCADPMVARLIQTTMTANASSFNNNSNRSCVSKQYLARVVGRFPSTENDRKTTALPSLSNDGFAQWEWIIDDRKEMITNDDFDSNPSAMSVQVDAPIETVDPLNGIRKITPKGKASKSLFRLLEYDAKSDTSIITCVPVTGRSHQLRVHLEWLGHCIVNDVQYSYVIGKTVVSNAAEFDPSAGTQRMVDSVREYNSYAMENEISKDSSPAVTDAKAKAAREICATCDLDTEGRGPSSAFSPAQLLQGGHAICLHAYRYSLAFPSDSKQGSNQTKHSNSNSNNNENDEKNSNSKYATLVDAGEAAVFRVDLKVDLPPWASHLRSRFRI